MKRGNSIIMFMPRTVEQATEWRTNRLLYCNTSPYVHESGQALRNPKQLPRHSQTRVANSFKNHGKSQPNTTQQKAKACDFAISNAQIQSQ